MPVYSLGTKINSNAPPDSLLYDLCIYRMDANRVKHSLIDVKQQSLLNDYCTQRHPTADISEPLSTICIMEVILHRKKMLHTDSLFPQPFTRMYTLEEFATGKAWSTIKRENPCYFLSTATSKLASQGGALKTVQITRPERPFIAKKYPAGSPLDPFEQAIIAAEINQRFYHRTFPHQGLRVCVVRLPFSIACKGTVRMFMRKQHENYGNLEKRNWVSWR